MPRRDPYCRGFTLLELLAVLAILALVAAIGVSRMGDAYAKAQLDTALSSVATYDDHARRLAASRSTPVELRVDLNEGRLTWELEGESIGQPLNLPSAVEIERFLSARERKTSGVATARLGRLGSGESYALKISTRSRPSVWVLFTGGSGQPVRLPSTRDVEEVFRVLRKQGADAP